ncbi:MAG: hypothetical protein AB1782_16200 [Cyanobacteriota bacterium]
MNLKKLEGFIDKGFRLSKEQLNYLADHSYGFFTQSGSYFYRNLRVIAQNIKTGYVIVKETYDDGYEYEKSYYLSPEGRKEKIKISDT